MATAASPAWPPGESTPPDLPRPSSDRLRPKVSIPGLKSVRVRGVLGFRGWELGFMIQGLGFRVWGLGFGFTGYGFRVQGYGFRG